MKVRRCVLLAAFGFLASRHSENPGVGFPPSAPTSIPVVGLEAGKDRSDVSKKAESVAGIVRNNPFEGLPAIGITSGNSQAVQRNFVTPRPIVVTVRDKDRRSRRAVHLSVTAPLTGKVHKYKLQALHFGLATIDLETDANGEAIFFARGPEEEGEHRYVIEAKGETGYAIVKTDPSLGPPAVTDVVRTQDEDPTHYTVAWHFQPINGRTDSTFEIYIKADEGEWQHHASLPHTARSWTDTSNYPGTTIHYRIHTAYLSEL